MFCYDISIVWGPSLNVFFLTFQMSETKKKQRYSVLLNPGGIKGSQFVVNNSNEGLSH